MPRTATLIARDTSGAYRYLPKSVETFLTSEQLAEQAKAAIGFNRDRREGEDTAACTTEIVRDCLAPMLRKAHGVVPQRAGGFASADDFSKQCSPGKVKLEQTDARRTGQRPYRNLNAHLRCDT